MCRKLYSQKYGIPAAFRAFAQLFRICVRCRSGFRMLGKTYGENSGPTRCRQASSSALHLPDTGTFLIPAAVFDSLTRMVSLSKSMSSHFRTSASRFERRPVSRINTASALMCGSATARKRSSSSYVAMCGLRRMLRSSKNSTSVNGVRAMNRFRSASRSILRSTARSRLTVAGPTPTVSRSSLKSSMRSGVIRESRNFPNLGFILLTEDA